MEGSILTKEEVHKSDSRVESIDLLDNLSATADLVNLQLDKHPPFIGDIPEAALTLRAFRKSGFIARENWTNRFFFKAKVISNKADTVTCDCLIDEEKSTFQTRIFPAILFKNLRNLKIGALVYIKTFIRPGASKIEIFDGKGIVNDELFNEELEWEKLKNTQQAKPFSYA